MSSHCILCSCPWKSSVTATSSSLSPSTLSTAPSAPYAFPVSKFSPTPSKVPLRLQILPVHGNPGSENCYHRCFQLPSDISMSPQSSVSISWLYFCPYRLCRPLSELALVQLAVHHDHEGLFHRAALQPLSLHLV